MSEFEQLDIQSVSSEGEASEEAVSADGAYRLHTAAYSGPFELLLSLIRSREIDIFDIPIAELTAAYLSALQAMERQGIELASEFLLMAASLIQIKSRLLLPRQADEDVIEADDVDPRETLVRQLLEYQAFKEVSQALESRDRLGRDFFLRPAGQDKPEEEEPELPAQGIYKLARAFQALIKKDKYQAPHDIYVERITIGERIAQIADALAQKRRISFTALCQENYHREEVITTFLALLEMTRLKLITVAQRGPGAPVYVQAQVADIDSQGEEAASMLDE